MLSGYNREAEIIENEFSYIGDSVIASWGYTKEVDGVEGNDGTNGNQPRGTTIMHNLVHENGHYSKQASPYFQAKTAQTHLEGNIFMNGTTPQQLSFNHHKSLLYCVARLTDARNYQVHERA